ARRSSRVQHQRPDGGAVRGIAGGADGRAPSHPEGARADQRPPGRPGPAAEGPGGPHRQARAASRLRLAAAALPPFPGTSTQTGSAIRARYTAVMAPRSTSQQDEQQAVRPGPVMVIGGAEDKLRDKVILHRFVELAGGADARIVVVATASSLGDEATELYSTLFTGLGAAHVWGLRPLTREYANDRSMSDILEGATGGFLTGGNQLR